MGPTALFDKSFLQSLSLDEAVWFDHFFCGVLCPLFYVETLADLEKAFKDGRSAEHEVATIAARTPEMHSYPCIHHQTLAFGNLMGEPVPMTGQVPLGGARPVKVNGERGAVFRQSPESKAFGRWQRQQYQALERESAREWRAALADLDLKRAAQEVKDLGIDRSACKTWDDCRAVARDLVHREAEPYRALQLICRLLSLPSKVAKAVMARWVASGCPVITGYAPYAAYVLEVELFFRIALAAGRISTDRASNRVDIAYLFYLPFCQVFVSGDRLHKHCAPLFLSDGQEFVDGQALKGDLRELNAHFLTLDEGERAKGIASFASEPVATNASVVLGIWERKMPVPRGAQVPKKDPDPKAEGDLIRRLDSFSKAEALPLDLLDFDAVDADVVSIERMVRKRRGAWWQLPEKLKAD